MNTVYELNEKEVAKAVAYWLENGSPEPKKPGSVHFSYDDPLGQIRQWRRRDA